MTGILVKRIGNVGLYVVGGDITQIPTPAIMTAINSAGSWDGGVDRAIMSVAETYYHDQARAAMPLTDLQTIVARGDRSNHRGQFDDVVFVVDDSVMKIEHPASLDKVVYAGLLATHNQGYERLLIPAIRMGVAVGIVEKTPRETVTNLGKGITDFMRDYGSRTRLEDITFVIYRDPEVIKRLESGLRMLQSLD